MKSSSIFLIFLNLVLMSSNSSAQEIVKIFDKETGKTYDLCIGKTKVNVQLSVRYKVLSGKIIAIDSSGITLKENGVILFGDIKSINFRPYLKMANTIKRYYYFTLLSVFLYEVYYWNYDNGRYGFTDGSGGSMPLLILAGILPGITALIINSSHPKVTIFEVNSSILIHEKKK